MAERAIGLQTPGVLPRLTRRAVPMFAGVLVLSLIANLSRFAAPLYVVFTVDTILSTGSLRTLTWLTAAAITGVIIGAACDIGRRRLLVRVADLIDGGVAPLIVERSLFNTRLEPTGDPKKQLGHLRRLRSFTARYMFLYLDLVFTPIFLLAIFYIHSLLGAIVAGGIGLLMLVVWFKDYAIRSPKAEAKAASDQAARLINSARTGRESFAGLSMGQSFFDRWKETADSGNSRRLETEKINITFNVVIQNLGWLIRICVVAVGIWLYLRNAVTLGGIFAARIIAGLVYRIFQQAARNIQSFQEARIALNQLRPLLAIASTPSVAEAVEEGIRLHAESLTFRYPRAGKNLFRKLSFSLEPGQLLLVTGSARRGKTTLARLLVGLLPPTDGRVRLGDADVEALPSGTKSVLFGYAPQQTELFEGSIRENISRFSDRPLDEVIEAARLAGIHKFVSKFPQGYDTPVASVPTNLSASERKRIAIARAFFGAPRVIVLDEPLSNLDVRSRKALTESLMIVKASGAIIIVTQCASASRLRPISDKVLNLNAKKPAVRECLVSDIPHGIGTAQ